MIGLSWFTSLVFIISWIKLINTNIKTNQPKFDVKHNNPPNSRICKKCSVERKGDMHHCVQCEVCIDGFIHHFGVIGTCIGNPNLKYFFNFLLWGGLIFFFYGVALTMVTETYYDSKVPP